MRFPKLLKKVQALLLVVSISMIGILAPATTALAAPGAIDAPQSAGTQQDPHLEYTDRAFPCTKYVAPVTTSSGTPVPGGSRSGTGTSTDPWLSIKYAAEQATLGTNGQTICIRAGVYQENHIVPKVSGTWGQPMAFLAQPGPVTIIPDPSNPEEAKQPVFDFTNDHMPEFGYWGVDSLTIDRSFNGIHYEGPAVRMQGLRVKDRVVPYEEAAHHLIAQNLKIRNGKAGSGILIRGRVHDVLLRNIQVENQHRWMHEVLTRDAQGNVTNQVLSDPQYTKTTDNHRRTDTHGISIEGYGQPTSNTPKPTAQDPGTPTRASVERILVEKSTFRNVGGDGIQCIGVNDLAANPDLSDPKNIQLADNTVNNVITQGTTPAVTEDGYDIKSCQNVTIRGRNVRTASSSTINELKATLPGNDSYGNNSDAAGIVVHYHARNILIESNRITNACWGIKVGRPDKKVRNVVIRGNLIADTHLNELQGVGAGTSLDHQRCRGRALQITNADDVDIYNNTLDNIQTTGIQLADSGYSATAATVPQRVNIWNNIVSLKDNRAITTPATYPGHWIYLAQGSMSEIDSDYNLFWHPDNSTNHFFVPTTRQTLATWQASSSPQGLRDPNSQRTNPSFVTGQDRFLAPGSVARNTALTTPGYNPCGTGLDKGYVENDCP